MIDTLLEPFSYNYMYNAMWVSPLVGGVCAFLSSYLMLKGWSLVGDALSHSVVPRVAGAFMLGLPFSVGAYISYFLDGATGGVIVTLQTLIFLTAFVFAPKHGMLASRRKAAQALAEPRESPADVDYKPQETAP